MPIYFIYSFLSSSRSFISTSFFSILSMIYFWYKYQANNHCDTKTITKEDFFGLMAESETYQLFIDTFKTLDPNDSGFVRAKDLDRILCGVRDLISDDRKSIIDVEDMEMMVDYEQFSRMLLGTSLKI